MSDELPDPCEKRNSLCRGNQRKSTLANRFADESRQDGSPPCDLLAVAPRYLVLLAPGSRALTLACHGSFHLDFSRASKDGCSTQKDVHLSKDP